MVDAASRHPVAAADAGAAALRRAIAAAAARGSVETSTRDQSQLAGYPALLPAGTEVYLTWLPGFPYQHLVSAARALRRAGMIPVPHVVARRFVSREQARECLDELRAEAAVDRVLVVGGDMAALHAAPFPTTLAFFEAGLLQAAGIRRVAIAGFPEGHPRATDEQMVAALHARIRYARENGLELSLMSQFCFDGRAIADWLERLRGVGVVLPVRVGLAGPATLKALIAFGARCGVGPSLRALRSHALSLTRILVTQGPDDVVSEFARAVGPEGISRLAGLHLYSFGGVPAAAQWLGAAAAGRFQLAG